jgi:DNA-directed RNA polymerase sigma subunit (sigma70/sigma32)
LSTYIIPWMKTRMDRAIKNQTLTIDIPEHIQDMRALYRRKISVQINQLRRYPRIIEAAEMLEIPPEKMLTILNPVKQPYSLETPVTWDSDSPLADFIADIDTINPEDALLQKQELESTSELIKLVLRTLPLRQARIFCLTYAFEEDVDGSTKLPRTCRTVQTLLQKEGINISKALVALDLRKAIKVFTEALKTPIEQS